MSTTPSFVDRIMETSTTTGTGTLTLGGAVSGFQAWSALGDGKSAYYSAVDVDARGNPTGSWEVGLGTYTLSGTTLARDTILASSNSNAAVSWSAGTRRVSLTLPAAQSIPQSNPIIFTQLPGAKLIPLNTVSFNLAIGHNDLYTCPTGRRAIFLNTSSYNPSAGTITFYQEIKVSGTYYRAGTSSSPAAGAWAFNLFFPIMLEAGDVAGINCATTAGLNAQCFCIEFDANCAIKQGRKMGLSTGDNTIYTVPAGKSAHPLNTDSLAWMIGGPSNGMIIIDGTNRTIFYHIVPSGGSPGSGNRCAFGGGSGAATANQRFNLGFTSTLQAGDFLNMNIDVGNAAQWCAVWVHEI